MLRSHGQRIFECFPNRLKSRTASSEEAIALLNRYLSPLDIKGYLETSCLTELSADDPNIGGSKSWWALKYRRKTNDVLCLYHSGLVWYVVDVPAETLVKYACSPGHFDTSKMRLIKWCGKHGLEDRRALGPIFTSGLTHKARQKEA